MYTENKNNENEFTKKATHYSIIILMRYLCNLFFLKPSSSIFKRKFDISILY